MITEAADPIIVAIDWNRAGWGIGQIHSDEYSRLKYVEVLEAEKTVLASGYTPGFYLCVQTGSGGDVPVKVPTDDAADSIYLLSGYAARIQLVCWIEVHYGGIP